jgi:hypothetical protein
MVQSKRSLPAPKAGTPDNSYWAIADVTNHSHVDYSSQPITLAVYNDRLNRKERNLLAYETCTVAELRGFVNARRLKLPTNSRRTKADYINTLQAADDEPDLSRFFDLAPPELREMVYKEYFNALPDLPLNPHQPPLVLASSRLRQEALPSYYSECTFSLTINTLSRRPYPSATLHMPVLLGSSGTAPGRLGALDLSRIRHFTITHRHMSGRRYHYKHVSTWVVDLRGKDGPVVSEWEDAEHWEHNRRRAERRKRLGVNVPAVLRIVWARPGLEKLMHQDLSDLLNTARLSLL